MIEQGYQPLKPKVIVSQGVSSLNQRSLGKTKSTADLIGVFRA